MNDRAAVGGADRFLLVGEVGRTKTVLALYPWERDTDRPFLERTYASQEYPEFESIVDSFLSGRKSDVVGACFALAGPNVQMQARAGPPPWEIDARRVCARFDLKKVQLLSDLEAMARSIPRLSPLDLLALHSGRRAPRGPIALIASGTGLEEACFAWDGERYDYHRCEGGRADFAPTGDLQSELFEFLLAESGPVSVERVASGAGIPNVYRFLRDVRGMEEPGDLAERLAHAADPTPIIVSGAVDSQCALCEETVRTFVSILGAEAGDLALKLLAIGGVYLGGRLPLRILPFLRDGRFAAALREKGRFEPLLERIPIYVILNPRSVLLGAAQRGRQDLSL